MTGMPLRAVAAMMCLAALGNAPALAQSAADAGGAPVCPVPDDLTSGIRAEYADGGTVEIRAAGPGEIAFVETAPEAGPDDPGLSFLSRLGLYDTEVWETTGALAANPDRMLRYDYTEDPAKLPSPVSGESWLGGVTTIWPDGSRGCETAVYVFGRTDRRTIGGCEYVAMPVKASFMQGDDWVAQDFLYFPDLGFAVATGINDNDRAQPFWRALARMTPIAR
ncbi:MAG: hypothetical protein H6895_11915 [Defluviimonas sp.]|uniref:hypothetical protein n=1 Tax=Albidovulum sp. TaxID=1872424 RepID=UPI002A2F6501|nr:hypothetical protein [Defluviimonas sp.]